MEYQSSFKGLVESNFLFGIILILIAVVSLALSILLIYINHKRQRAVWTADGVLLALIASIDALTSIYIVVSQSIRLSTGGIVTDGGIWCRFSSVLGRATGIASLDLIALLSLARYFGIVRGHKIKRTPWIVAGFGVVLIIWVIYSIKDFFYTPVVFPSGMYCASDGKPSDIFSKVFTILVLIFAIPPLFIIPYCYVKVTRHYTQILYEMRINQIRAPVPLQRRVHGLWIIVLAYAFAVLPEYFEFFAFLIFNVVPSPTVDGLVRIFALNLTLINSAFALFFHEETWRELVSCCSSWW